jgi:hypothetical protein
MKPDPACGIELHAQSGGMADVAREIPDVAAGQSWVGTHCGDGKVL